MNDKILVTGATGTVGSAVVNALSSKGANVRAAVHAIGKADKIGAGVEKAVLDYTAPDTWKAAFDGVGKVFLATPVPLVDNQVDLAARLIDAAKLAGVRHIVRLSGAGADALPGISLARWHRTIERYLIGSGLAFTILRPMSFMQNFVNYYHPVDGRIYLPLGSGKVSYVDARDIAAVAYEALTKDEHAGKAYTITGGEALSVQDAADIISEETGKKAVYVDTPEGEALLAMKKYGMPDLGASALMELYAICKAGYAGGITNTVEELTGRKPITFRRFARDYVGRF